MEELTEASKPTAGRKRPRLSSSSRLSACAGLLGLAIIAVTQVTNLQRRRFSTYQHPYQLFSVQGNSSTELRAKQPLRCGLPNGPAPPQSHQHLPWVWDVFASGPDHSRAFFIAQDPTACHAELDKDAFDFTGTVFLCRFSDGSLVSSSRLREKNDLSNTLVFYCPIPEALRPLVLNTEDRAVVTVSLISTRGLEPLSEAVPVLGPVGLCAGALVNEGVVLPRPPPETRHYVVGTIWMTGDTFQVIECFENLGSPRRKCRRDSHLPRLKEWLDFHLMVGMDHIYVYDNSKQPHSDLWAVVRPYAQAGRVTYHHWPFPNCMQTGKTYADWGGELHVSHFAAENSALRRYGDGTRWLIHFDADEYLLPSNGHESLPSALRALEAKAPGVAVFKLQMHYYGRCPNPSDRMVSPGGQGQQGGGGLLFLERLRCRGQPVPDFKTKSLIRPDAVMEHQVHYAVVDFENRGNLPTYKVEEDGGDIRIAHLRSINLGNVFRLDPQDPLHTQWAPRLRQYRESDEYVLRRAAPGGGVEGKGEQAAQARRLRRDD